ncbi:sensor histidine kinase [Streptomyces sp. NPDC006784]|uniref:sensor histidine kinase n=1 Tax=Streptomyces sp. NPDC006784 TaxID=3364764 RepID=UPI0036B13121
MDVSGAVEAREAAARMDEGRPGATSPGRRVGGPTGAALLAAGRGFVLMALSLGVSLALFVMTLVSLVLTLLGIGAAGTPWLLHVVRVHADQRRVLAREWAGLDIPTPYRPLPPGPHGLTGHVERCVLMLKDPATWRDLCWLLTDAVAGFVLALLPTALIGYGLEGWVMFAGVWQAVAGDYWYGFIHLETFGDAALCAVLGSALLVLARFVNPHLITAHFLLAGGLLAPTRGARLSRRVEQLYETRHDAVDTSAAELRRIERDLHDGAQARLVAMGMSLGTIEALVEQDPGKAKRLLGQARASSAEALTELRDLVRGIHPPVLAERGLGDAAEALALRTQVPVETDIELPGRFAEPVESAAYFAVSEVLTNAVKHAEADHIWLDIHYSYGAGGMLRISVTDDGAGGADASKGSGIAGIERRLGPFDGIVAVSSPPGGPTMVTLEIPCRPVPRA